MLRALFTFKSPAGRGLGAGLKPWAARWPVLLAGMMMLLAAGCSFTTKQSTLDPHGPVARDQMDLFMVTVRVTGFIFVVVGSTAAWVVWRFREKPEDVGKPMPHQAHGNPLIEIGLIGSSIALLVIIAIPTLKSIFFTMDMPTDNAIYPPSKLGVWYPSPPVKSAEEVLEVTVYGYQWWWGFDYKQFGLVTANELVLPEGVVVKMNLRARDVIHSFWLPKLAGKVDVIPGRANWLWLMADQGATGLYYGQCAEYCGEAHAYMLFRARVVSREDFVKWMEQSKKPVLPPGVDQPWATKALQDLAAKDPKSEATDPQKATALWAAFLARGQEDKKNNNINTANLKTEVEKGAFLFFDRSGCAGCHTINGSPAAGVVGPNLSQVASRTSLAAGILDNLGDNGKIDPDKQLSNLHKWISDSIHVKPGNKMYTTPVVGLRDVELKNKNSGADPTAAQQDQDYKDIAAFIQTLK